MAIAAMVGAVAGASAQATIEVDQETPESNAHCPGVVVVGHGATGGCQVTAHTLSNLVAERHDTTPVAAETVILSCANEFEAAIGENGSGYLFHQQLTPVGPPCNLVPCDEASGESHAWPFSISEPGATSAEHEMLNFTFCTRLFTAAPGSPGTSCNMNVGLEQIGDHQYVLVANESPCVNLGGIIEFSGSWIIEEPIEIEHDNDPRL
jgi:hypothetical protein